MSEPNLSDPHESAPVASPSVNSRRPRRRTVTLVLAAGGLAGGAALSVAAVSGAGAATPTPKPSTSSSSAPAAPAPAKGAPAAGAEGVGPGFGGPGGGGPGGPGGPGHGGPGRGMGGPGRDGGPGGVVTAISSTSLSVKSPAGTTKTYTLNSSTKYHAGPATTLSQSDITVGDRVAVRTGSRTSTTATEVDEQLPQIDGTVVSVSGSTITVTDRDGFQRVITTTGTTKYTKKGSASTASAVTTGTMIHATGRVDANKTTLDSTGIDVVVPPTTS